MHTSRAYRHRVRQTYTRMFCLMTWWYTFYCYGMYYQFHVSLLLLIQVAEFCRQGMLEPCSSSDVRGSTYWTKYNLNINDFRLPGKRQWGGTTNAWSVIVKLVRCTKCPNRNWTIVIFIKRASSSLQRVFISQNWKDQRQHSELYSCISIQDNIWHREMAKAYGINCKKACIENNFYKIKNYTFNR